MRTRSRRDVLRVLWLGTALPAVACFGRNRVRRRTRRRGDRQEADLQGEIDKLERENAKLKSENAGLRSRCA